MAGKLIVVECAVLVDASSNARAVEVVERALGRENAVWNVDARVRKEPRVRKAKPSVLPTGEAPRDAD